MKKIVRVFILISLFLIGPSADASFDIEGFLQDSDGNAIPGNYKLWISIQKDGDPSCVLYREVFSSVSVDSTGSFVVTVGSGTPTSTSFGNTDINQVLKNQVEQTCYDSDGNFKGNYTPSADAVRALSAEFEIASGNILNVGTMTLTAVPYAIYAKQLEKHTVDSLLRVEDGGIPKNVSALTSADFTELMALVGGTSTQYLKHSSSEGAV